MKSFVSTNNHVAKINILGDMCELIDGTRGICKIDKDCPYFIDLIKRNKRNEIVKCGFKGINQIICCKADNANFRKVLCEEDVQKIPAKPVR